MNALYIEIVESFPDTTITLTNGNKYVVREKESEVRILVEEFFTKIQPLAPSQHLEAYKDE